MRLLLFLALLAAVGHTIAQPTLTIGTNTNVVGTGAVQLVYGGGSLTNNGLLSLATGPLTLAGATTYGGSGTATVGDVVFAHPTGTSTLNALLSVTNQATLSANATVNANGQLYLRTDQFAGANLVNNGLLTGTVQGLLTNASMQTGATVYGSQLSVNVGGSVVRYQWQLSADNSQWIDLTGATAATYTAGVVSPVYYRNRLTTANTAYEQFTPSVYLAYTGPPACANCPTRPIPAVLSK